MWDTEAVARYFHFLSPTLYCCFTRRRFIPGPSCVILSMLHSEAAGGFGFRPAGAEAWAVALMRIFLGTHSHPAGKTAEHMAARRQMACVALIAMAVAGACWARMGTFATGEDPATYIRLAKRVLESGFSLQSLVEIVDFLAPVFPLWVTAIVGLAGPLAVYVVHPVLWVALMVITARWATCVFREERPLAVCWMGVLIPIFLIGGYPLNIHFLLLPFRETMALAMAVAGLLVWLRAVQRASFGLGLLAGALVLLTIGIREPMLLAFVGPTLVSMVATRRGRGSARPIWGLLTLPLVSAAGALLLLLSGRLSPNLQMHLW